MSTAPEGALLNTFGETGCPAPRSVFEGPPPALSTEERAPAATYGRVLDALKALLASLGEQKDVWRVVFGCGTVVEVTEGPEFGGFTSNNSCFPAHRAADERAYITYLQGNRLAWGELKKAPGEAGVAARQALEALVADGYPHPGGEGADRAVRKETGFWRTVWPARDPRIYNIWACTDRDTAHGVGDVTADLRRYDCMTPRVFAVVAPNLAVTYM